jgi:uncharacterized membrane protein
MFNIKEYLSFIFLYLIIDLVWLKGAKKLHQRTYKQVTGKDEMEVNYLAVILFYLVAPLGYIVFIKNKYTGYDVFKYGMLMGLLLYSTYDFTSKAIYNKSYDWSYALLDIAWGTFVFGLVSYIIHKKFN